MMDKLHIVLALAAFPNDRVHHVGVFVLHRDGVMNLLTYADADDPGSVAHVVAFPYAATLWWQEIPIEDDAVPWHEPAQIPPWELSPSKGGE
jgi:hypothetical protein